MINGEIDTYKNSKILTSGSRLAIARSQSIDRLPRLRIDAAGWDGQNEQRKLEEEVQCRFEAYGTSQSLFRFQRYSLPPIQGTWHVRAILIKVCRSLLLNYM